MSTEELKYIFSESACLTPKQMKRYVRSLMTNEESYAVELHLNSCPFCNEAVEGLFEQREGNAAEVVTHLSNDFLKEHFSVPQPKVHLNSMAPSHHVAHPQPHVQPRRRKRFRTESIWKPSSLAAALLIGIGMIWFAKQRQQLKTGQASNVSATVAQQTHDMAEQTGNDRLLASADLVEVKDDPVPVSVPEANVANMQLQQSAQASTQLQAVNAGGEEPTQQPKPVQTKAKPATPPVRQEATVAQYRVPQEDKYQPEPSAPSETLEHPPVRASSAPVTTATEKYSDDGDSGAVTERAREATASLSADDLYGQGKYSAALAAYKQQMNVGGRGKRNYATLQAARCHLALGSKQAAIQLLQSIVSEGGAHKRAAKRLLQDLGAEQGE